MKTTTAKLLRVAQMPPRTIAVAATLIALVVYPMGLGLPAITVEKFGRVHESSILSGCLSLFTEGRLFLGLVVGLTALVLPTVKLFGLIWVSTADPANGLRRRLLPILATIGRWGFLDLFVAGALVAWVQLNSMIRIEPRVGLVFFGMSILLSYIASRGLERDHQVQVAR